MKTKVIFVGAVELSFYALTEMIKQGILPEVVITLEDKYSKRHSDWAGHKIKALAINNGIQVWEVDNINDHVLEIGLREPDYIFVFGWSQIIKPELLAVPKHGCLGLHPSLLPANRGRGVIPWTILNQDIEQTGISIFFLDEGIDSGDIVAQRRIDIWRNECATTLYWRMLEKVSDLISEIAPMVHTKTVFGQPQDHSQANYLARRVSADGKIDWHKPAKEIVQLVRAVTRPYPGAWTFHKDIKIIIWDASVEQSNHQGTVGQILYVKDNRAIIQCGQGQVAIEAMQALPGENYTRPDEFFKDKIHQWLG